MTRTIAVLAALSLLSFGAQARRNRAEPPPPPPEDVGEDSELPPEAPAAPRAPLPPRPPQVNAAPLPPKPPRPPKAPRAFRAPLQFEFEMPEIEIPDMDFDFHFELPELMAQKMAHRDRDPEDDEDTPDGDDENDWGNGREQNGVRIYRMNRNAEREAHRAPRAYRRSDRGDRDERNATAQARGNGSATLQVKGPVTFQVHAQGGDIEVVASDRQQVSVSVSDAPAEEIALYAFGDRVEPAFKGKRLLKRGRMRVELPRGSRLDVTSMSGDVVAEKIGEVRVRTMSGDVKLAAVGKSDVQTISGDVRIDDASGPVRLHLVSGRATVQTAGTSPQVEFQSASGSLNWGGLCGRDCHVSAETVSGDLLLAVDPKSSFELSYTSHSGELRDELNLAVKHTPRRKHGMASGWLEATFGKGEGVIEADAFSGNLIVKKK